jgi:hypothetical protein
MQYIFLIIFNLLVVLLIKRKIRQIEKINNRKEIAWALDQVINNLTCRLYL